MDNTFNSTAFCAGIVEFELRQGTGGIPLSMIIAISHGVDVNVAGVGPIVTLVPSSPELLAGRIHGISAARIMPASLSCRG